MKPMAMEVRRRKRRQDVAKFLEAVIQERVREAVEAELARCLAAVDKVLLHRPGLAELVKVEIRR